MSKLYIIAGNAVRIAVEDDLPAWEMIEPRYRPFEAEPSEIPVLEIGINVGAIQPCYQEPIYEPEFKGIGFVTSKAMRLPDGRIAIEFKHIDETRQRLCLTMSAYFDMAEILIDPTNDGNDHYFLTHALMIAYMLASSGNGTLIIHSSCVVYDGKAYLFQGKSGTGKSTHARLWLQNIEGARLLNDDNPVIRFSKDGAAMVYGSPWSGKTPCYRNASAPIGAFVRIIRAQENELLKISPLKGYASLTASVAFLPFISETLREIRHKTIERLAMTVPCYEMHCRPDAEAAMSCEAGLSGGGEKTK